MSLNIHPIVVHFPVALLSVFAVSTFIYFGKVRDSKIYLYVQTVFLVLGSVSAFVAQTTGEMAVETIGPNGSLRNLIEKHESFAVATTTIFTALSSAFLIKLYLLHKDSIRGLSWARSYIEKIEPALKVYSKIIFKLLPLFGMMGLVFITITGALGASIVYGPDIDPVVSFVYHLFF